MANHAHRLCRVTGDQNALALSQQMADQISYGMRLPRAGRALHQNASMFLKLLGNSDLLWIRRFAQ